MLSLYLKQIQVQHYWNYNYWIFLNWMFFSSLYILRYMLFSFFCFRLVYFDGWIRSYGRGRERGQVSDGTALVKMAYGSIVRQKLVVCVPLFSKGTRLRPYTVKYNRKTITCFMAKYGRIRRVFGMYAIVYGTVYDHLRSP